MPARAADRDRQVALALGHVARQGRVEERLEALEIRWRTARCPARSPAPRDRCPDAGRSSGTQCGFGRNRTSNSRSASRGAPYLKPNETTETWRPVLGRRVRERVAHPVAELVGRQPGRVDHEVGVAAKLRQDLRAPCGCPRRPGPRARAGDGAGSPRTGGPGPRRMPRGTRSGRRDACSRSSSNAFESSPKKTPPRASTTIATRVGEPGRMRQLGHLGQQRRRQVVDDEEPEVLERVRDLGSAGARQPRDDREALDRGASSVTRSPGARRRRACRWS